MKGFLKNKGTEDNPQWVLLRSPDTGSCCAEVIDTSKLNDRFKLCDGKEVDFLIVMKTFPSAWDNPEKWDEQYPVAVLINPQELGWHAIYKTINDCVNNKKVANDILEKIVEIQKSYFADDANTIPHPRFADTKF